jgi:acylglycerol lipase
MPAPLIPPSHLYLLLVALIGAIHYLSDTSDIIFLLLAGISLIKLVTYCCRENDDPDFRRRAFKNLAKPEWFHPDLLHSYTEKYFTNSRGMALMSFTAAPKSKPPKALVIFCHGYLDSSTWYKGCVYRQYLVSQGYALASCEVEGHGRSDGLGGLINDWQSVVNDIRDFTIQTVASLATPTDLPVFIAGESMGGALALDVSQQFPELFRGAIMVAPMVGVHDDMKPSKLVMDLFKVIVGPSGSDSFIGKVPLAPSGDLSALCYKVPALRAIAEAAPSHYGRLPRFATARELILTTERLSAKLSDYSCPFLIMHGSLDRVTDPAFSKQLYDSSCSKDKTHKVYDGAWHVLTTGEPDEVREVVFRDMIQWLDERVN